MASAKSSGKPGANNGTGAGTDGAEGAGKGKNKKKLIIMVVLALLIAGAAAKFTILAPAPSKTPPAPKPGPTVTLDEMTVNLDGGHFLRIQVALETAAGKSSGHGASTTFDTAKAAQAVISTFSDRKMTDLAGEKAREAAKAQLLTALQQEYPKEILGVVYTAFVMQ
jgi:flagellar FliL protein